MKSIIGNGITALVLLELLPEFHSIGSEERLGGQMGFQFDLGPRILHDTPEVRGFLNRIGIDTEANRKEYKVGYVYNNRAIEYPTYEQSQAYYLKTRGNVPVNSSFMNSGKKVFAGYDMREIGLLERLIERNKNRVINSEVVSIDVLGDNGKVKVNGYECEEVISTIDFADFARLANLVGEPQTKAMEEYKREVVFSRVKSLEPEEVRGTKVYDFVYFLNDSEINRITLCSNNPDTFIIESNQPLTEFVIEANSCKLVDSVTMRSQIVKELKIHSYLGVTMAGRYAQYNHSERLDTIIKRYWNE